MFGFHPIDLVVVLAIVVLLVGGKRLAGIGEALGKSVAGYRRAVRGDDEKDEQLTASDQHDEDVPLLPDGKTRSKA